jgi:release factor glutamine methyltransferase
VICATQNVARNDMTGRIDVRESDLFAAVDGRFDLVLFDPPFRWFRPRDMRERAIADENYETLTRFFAEVRKYLTLSGRLLLSFGTTGDIDYLRRLMRDAAFDATELRKVEFVKDELPVAYFAWRLVPVSPRL